MIQVLFLCTGNSCRSQMAEGLCRHLRGDTITPYSAGVATHGLNPNAVKVMAEIGIDISDHTSKHVLDLMDTKFDYVITICSSADETCPTFPGHTKVIYRGFDDPPKLARNAATKEEALEHYRRVRDEIRAYITSLPEALHTA